MPWTAIVGAVFGALPELIKGLSAFQTKHAELRSIALATHQQTVATDDAVLAARRAAQDAPTAPARRSGTPLPGDSTPGVSLPVAAKSNTASVK